jgi:hypothetical protein
MDWSAVMVPWFILDVIVVVALVVGRKFDQIYLSEKISLSMYTVFLGFPVGMVRVLFWRECTLEDVIGSSACLLQDSGLPLGWPHSYRFAP